MVLIFHPILFTFSLLLFLCSCLFFIPTLPLFLDLYFISFRLFLRILALLIVFTPFIDCLLWISALNFVVIIAHISVTLLLFTSIHLLSLLRISPLPIEFL